MVSTLTASSNSVRSSPVLVTWGESRMALAATRALGRAGIATAVLAEKMWAPAFASRHCTEAIEAPDADRGEPYLRVLESLAASKRYSGLFFCDDRSALLVGRQRERFISRLPFLLPDQENLELTVNKHAMMEFARRAAIPIPATAIPESVDDVVHAVRGMRYPLVVKGSGGFGSRHLRVVDSLEHATEAFARLQLEQVASGYGEAPHVQEWVQGPVFSALALCDRGDPVALFLMRKRRTFPAWGGPCIDAVSVDDPDLRRAALYFLAQLPWHGIIEIEFIRDDRDGRFLLVEPSPDPNWGLDLANHAGINFPALAWHLMQGVRPGPAQTKYKVGERFVWLLPEGAQHIAAHPRSAGALIGAALNPFVGSDLRQDDLRATARMAKLMVWALREDARRP